MRTIVLVVSLLSMYFSLNLANAQNSETPSLRETIISLDQKLFSAFNSCDLETFNQYLAEDV